LNGWSDYKVVLSDPTAFDLIYLPLYFHIFRYFIQFSITDFSKTSARAVATLLLPQNKKSLTSINFDVEVSNATRQLSCTTTGISSCVIYSLGYREVPLKWENVRALQPPRGAPCPVLGDFGGGREELAKDESNLGGSCILSGFKCAGFCGSPNLVGIEARTRGMPSVGCRCAH